MAILETFEHILGNFDLFTSRFVRSLPQIQCDRCFCCTGAPRRLCARRLYTSSKQTSNSYASGAQKLPATSELVDWVRVLHWQQRSNENVKSEPLTIVDQAVLFKIRHDLERYRAHVAVEARA